MKKKKKPVAKENITLMKQVSIASYFNMNKPCKPIL